MNAEELNIPAYKLDERLKKFQYFGLNYFNHDFNKSLEFLNEDDRILLQTPQMKMGGWLAGNIPIHEVILKSYYLKLTLKEVIERIDVFKHYNIITPTIHDEYLEYKTEENDLYSIGYHPKKHFFHNYNSLQIDNDRIINILLNNKIQPKEALNNIAKLQKLMNFIILEETDLMNDVSYDFEVNSFLIQNLSQNVLKNLTKLGFTITQ